MNYFEDFIKDKQILINTLEKIVHTFSRECSYKFALVRSPYGMGKLEELEKQLLPINSKLKINKIHFNEIIIGKKSVIDKDNILIILNDSYKDYTFMFSKNIKQEKNIFGSYAKDKFDLESVSITSGFYANTTQYNTELNNKIEIEGWATTEEDTFDDWINVEHLLEKEKITVTVNAIYGDFDGSFIFTYHYNNSFTLENYDALKKINGLNYSFKYLIENYPAEAMSFLHLDKKIDPIILEVLHLSFDCCFNLEEEYKIEQIFDRKPLIINRSPPKEIPDDAIKQKEKISLIDKIKLKLKIK